MYFECEDSERLKIQEQKTYAKAYQMHNNLLYHYATNETLWKILESDCFLARNIRFSNDSEEYKIGQSTIEKYIINHKELSDMEKKAILIRIKENPMMYYMICFCESGDLLSQWRGYAKDGVSIGLDFTGGITNKSLLYRHVEYFSILNNKKSQEMLKEKKEEERYYIEGNPLVFLQMPYKVQYTQPAKKLLSKNVERALNEIWNNGREEERISRLLQYIPFIKDKGFAEEAEFRLIYDMEFLGESKAHSSRVRSQKIDYLDVNNLKKPYISVEIGQATKKKGNVTEVVLGTDVIELAEMLQFTKSEKKVALVKDENRKGVYIGEGDNQEDILEWIEKYVEVWKVPQKKKNAVKMWCEGHLPIRKVIIGPGEKQIDMKESLEHYKNTVYWLRYIDVELSKIPLKN